MPIFIYATVLLLGLTSALAQGVLPTVRSGKVRSDGAVVCRSLAIVAFVTEQLRQGAGPPDLRKMGCALLLEGTPVTVEQDDRGTAIVTAETMFGKPIRGVTDLARIEFAPPNPPP